MLGALFMCAAMTLFAIEDALFKSVAPALPPGEATLIFGVTGTTISVKSVVRRCGKGFRWARSA